MKQKIILVVISALALILLGLAIGFVAGQNAIKATIDETAENMAESDDTRDDVAKEESVQDEAQEEIVKETEEDTKLPNVQAAVNNNPAGSALHVEGTVLKDENGNIVQLRGVSTHGIGWFPQYVNKECFEELRNEWGANVVRLAMYTAEYNGYCSDGDKEKLKQLIFDGVEYATQAGLYVIIDWHILSDGNPNQNIGESRVFFEEMSKKYADYTNVIYEICNEPNGNVSWQEIKTYAEEIIGIIRQHDEDAVILVGTPQWSQLVGLASADPITNYDNIMYTLHFYADTHRDWLRQELENAVQNGLPIFVSEYSICEASGNGVNNIQEADKWIELLDRYNISYVAWNLANKNESSSILSADCNKTSGFTSEDLSESGKWLKAMLLREERNSADYEPDTSEIVAYDDGVLRATLTLSDTWENGGNECSNYAVTVENLSNETVKNWELDLLFNEKIVEVQGWCGQYSCEGNVLHIKSAEFNTELAPQGKSRDMGFIVTGPHGIHVEEK